MFNYFDITWCASLLLLIIHDYFKKCESFPICRIPSVKFWWLMGVEIRGMNLVNYIWGHSAIRCCERKLGFFNVCVLWFCFCWILLGVQIKVWQGSSNLFLIELANIQSNNNWNSRTSIQGKKTFTWPDKNAQNGSENNLKCSTIPWAELATSAVQRYNSWCSQS